ncbi:MAG: Heimdall-CTERM domain-containing surface protein [Candidatus Heimdallarchaeota archaeon]
MEKKGIPGFESLGTLSSLAVLTIWWQKRRTKRKGSTFNVQYLR